MNCYFIFISNCCARYGRRMAAWAAMALLGCLCSYAQDTGDDQNLDPQAAGTGTVQGSVIDSATGEAVPSVAVVLEWPDEAGRELSNEVDRKKTVLTDEQGAYEIKDLPAGTYNLKMIKAGYEVGTLRQVKVEPGKDTESNFALLPKKAEMSDDIFDLEAFEVTAESYGEGSQDWLSNLKQESTGSIDFLSVEDFAKFGGTDLSDIVQRIPGVTVVEGQFAVVRGLGDRYNSTLVNGLPVPSPDPVRQGLQLDLFPTSIMSSVVTQKTFMPDMPSNSSGAGFNLITKSYPEETTVFFKAGVRFNSNSQETFLSNPEAGMADNFANGVKDRPSAPSPGPSAEVRAQTSRQIVPVTGKAPIGLSFEAGAGSTIEVGGRKLGLVFSSAYNSSYDTQFGEQQDRYATSSTYRIVPPGFPGPSLFGDPGSLFENELWASGLHYDMTTSEAEVQIGILAGVGYELDKDGDNRVDFTFLFSQTATDFVQTAENGYLPSGYSQGTTGNPDTDRGFGDPTAGGLVNNIVGRDGNNTLTVNTDTISYEQRNLQIYQLSGDHTLNELDDLHVSWGATISSTESKTPHETVTNYLYDNGTGPTSEGYLYARPSSIGTDEAFLTETWRNITEDLYGARMDFDYNWEDPYSDFLFGKLLSGIFWSKSTRDTEQVDTVFYGTTNNVRYDTKQGAADAILSSASTSAAVNNAFALNTRDDIAGYVSMDINITDSFKISGGGRFGNLQMTSQGDSNYSPTITLADFLNAKGVGNPDIRNGSLLGFDTLPNDSQSLILIQQQLDSGGEINRTFGLPAASFAWDITDEVVLRGGYSQTIAQPSFRELSPVFSRELGTGDTVVGNPLLQLSDVESFDLRLEYNFRPGSTVSVSGFYKTIENPIEQIVLRDPGGNNSVVSFFNNPNTATVRGVEFDFQTSMDFIAEELAYFSFGANFTYIDAWVPYSDNVLATYFSGVPGTNVSGPYVGTDGPPLGNNDLPTKRRLFDQPEYIANANITYNNPDWGSAITLSVYTQSDVLTAVGSGTNNSVDQYTAEFYQLDLTFSQELTENMQLSFRVTNITDTTRSIIYAPDQLNNTETRQSYKLGQSYSISLKYTF
ncbi:MAG: TonB-dependent receptor domain-containing protein [Puniceicoccales bacterium]